MAKHLIIDGNNLLFRCYWSAYNRFHETKPNTYGYFMLNVIKSYVNLFNPYDIIVTWDDRKGDEVNSRKEIDAEYKSNRVYNADVFEYVDQIREIFDSLGIRQLYPLNREGDDIMYWLCAIKYPNESILVSTDTDMYQLVTDELSGNIIYNPNKKIQISPVFLKLNYDVNDGKEFIIKKALKGDKADNISGVKRIRESKIKSIISLLSESNDMDGLKKSGILNDEEYQTFEKNKELMVLDNLKNFPEEINFYEEQLEQDVHPSKEKFRTCIKQMEYWNIYRNINSWYNIFQTKNVHDVILDSYYKLF